MIIEVPEKTDFTILRDNHLFKESLQENYNETYVYVLPKDPRSAYVIYEVSDKTKEFFKQKFTEQFFDRNYLVMHVYQVDGRGEFNGFNYNHKFEIDDFLGEKNNYWLNLVPEHEYVIELGYKTHGTSYFEIVARSNRFRMPRAEEQKEQRYVDWRQISCVPDPSHEVSVPAEKWKYNYYCYWKQGRVLHQPKEKGYWVLLLHNHLPFVRHPEYEIFLEEQWLFEAITSVYTQLISLFWTMEKEGIDFRIAVSLSPTLINMLRDPLLQQRYRKHIGEVIAFAEKEYANSTDKPFRKTVEQHLHRFFLARRVFETYQGDITRGFRDFQDQGKVEIITCPATHAILPFYLHYPEAIRAQINIALKQYERVFGRRPQGIWLPENAYHPGLDQFLFSEGIRWTAVNSHAIRQGDTKCFYGVESPVITKSGLCIFGIDDKTKGQVWSKRHGYPGDPRYKEWYRDVVWDADWDYVPDYFKIAGVRRNSGLKYYRVTGRDVPLDRKEYYNPDLAARAADEHAGQFVFHRGVQANEFQQKNHRSPVYFSAYDGELFGHWWEEGPYWLELVLRKMLYNQNTVRPVTPSEYLAEQQHHQLLNPNISSWGEGDFFATWLDAKSSKPNAWIYRHIMRLLDQMIRLATERKEAFGLEKRALNQAGREIFLAQSSDWGFLMNTGQAAQYSEGRVVRHIHSAKKLLDQVQERTIDEELLNTLESAHNLFAGEMDFRVFKRGT